MRGGAVVLGSMIVFAAMVPAQAQRPSFDCRKAQYASEFAICQDAELAKLDRILNAAYVYVKETQGQMAADEVAVPYFYRIRACNGDPACISTWQIEEIRALRRAGAP